MDSAHKEWTRYYRGQELDCLGVLHARFVQHRYPRHAHDYFVIALVEEGAASYWYQGAQHTASAGQVFVVNPGEIHTGDPATAGGYTYRVLYPRVEYLARVAKDIGTCRGVPLFKGTVLEDKRLVAILNGFHKRIEEEASAARCESLLLKALACLITGHADPRVTARKIGRERPAVRTACEYMQAHFDEDISLSKLAALVSLSPYYFARAFESETGLPPHAYLESVRVGKAREFLENGQSAASAALAAGYVDQSHLTHRFKRFLGITPGQYIRNGKILQDR
jgi:AraC-like DNA-binding protein